jgi:hypothetical protein
VWLSVGVLINRNGRHIKKSFTFLPEIIIADSMSADLKRSRSNWIATLFSPCSDANVFSTGQETPAFYEIRRLIKLSITASICKLSWARRIQTTPTYPIYGRCIILPYHLHLGHPSSLFFQRDLLLISYNIPNPSLSPKFWFIFLRPLIKIISIALKVLFLTSCSHTYYMHHRLGRFPIILTI